jgi:hypothetical protein
MLRQICSPPPENGHLISCATAAVNLLNDEVVPRLPQGKTGVRERVI